MRVSANDLYRMAQRSVEGAGAPPGFDMDAARAVEWLELRGLPGLAALVRDVGDGLAAADCCHLAARTKTELRFDRGSGMLLGALAVEWACAAPGPVQTIRGVVSPLGLLCEAAERARSVGGLAIALPDEGGGIGAAARWTAQSAEPTLYGDWHVAAGKHVTIACGAAASKLALPTGLAAVAPKHLAAIRRRHLAEGIEVADLVWQRITAQAARILVPASVLSRQHGAGAEASDND